MNIAVVGYFQSVERIKPATIFALLRGFVFLIPSFILLPKFLGVSGIWLAMPLGGFDNHCDSAFCSEASVCL